MKKTVLLVLLAVCSAAAVNAQKVSAIDLPGKVKASFEKKHPGVTAKWGKEDDDYEAAFKVSGKAITETYSADGMMKESEVDIKTTELPASVKDYVKMHYKGANTKEAAKITKPDGAINYEAEVNKMDVVFDANGQFLKEVKD